MADNFHSTVSKVKNEKERKIEAKDVDIIRFAQTNCFINSMAIQQTIHSVCNNAETYLSSIYDMKLGITKLCSRCSKHLISFRISLWKTLKRSRLGHSFTIIGQDDKWYVVDSFEFSWTLKCSPKVLGKEDMMEIIDLLELVTNGKELKPEQVCRFDALTGLYGKFNPNGYSSIDVSITEAHNVKLSGTGADGLSGLSLCEIEGEVKEKDEARGGGLSRKNKWIIGSLITAVGVGALTIARILSKSKTVN